MVLPGGTIEWSGPVRLPQGDARTILTALDGRRGQVPPLLKTPSKSLYALAMDGRPIYVGMVPATTVVARIRAHIRLAITSTTSVRGDLARLAPIMRGAFASRSRIDVWVGRITNWGPYSRDNKALHAFEILAANLLLSRRRLPVGYDRNTWTFEEERLLAAEEQAWTAEAWSDLLQLEAAAEAADLSVVGPRDSRVQEIDGHRFPHQLICHLCRDFGDGGCAGCTGTLITPNLVLTAAHCLWSHARRTAPRSITVMPGRTDRDSLPFGSRISRRFWIPAGFINGPRHMLWDFGVIVLERPFAHARRFMPMIAVSDGNLARLATEERVAVIGYPGDRPIGTLWRHEERIKKVTPRRLLYSMDTCPGHSGSPVIVHLKSRPQILAVHTMGILDAEGRSFGCGRDTVLAPPGLLNSGIRLIPRVIDAILHPTRQGEGPWRMQALP